MKRKDDSCLIDTKILMQDISKINSSLEQIKKILLGNGEIGLCEDHRTLKKEFNDLKPQLEETIKIVEKQNSILYFLKIMLANAITIFAIIAPFLPAIFDILNKLKKL